MSRKQTSSPKCSRGWQENRIAEADDLPLEEYLVMLTEFGKATGKSLEADRLSVRRNLPGVVPVGLPGLAVLRLRSWLYPEYIPNEHESPEWKI